MYEKGGSGKVSRNRGGRRTMRGAETRARKRAYIISLEQHFIADTHFHLLPSPPYKLAMGMTFQGCAPNVDFSEIRKRRKSRTASAAHACILKNNSFDS